MDVLLGRVTQQAMNYAIRSGIAITATYAIRQSSRLLQNAPQSRDRDELFVLQQRLHSKIRIISPAIDMIELIAARGNTSLESAVSLTKDIRLEIQSLAQRLANAAAAEESARSSRISSQEKARNESELKSIIVEVKKLLERIEDAVPLINLAITTSGASLSTNLPSTVSPSRLLQASTFLTAGDTQYAVSPHRAVQIGPTFTLSVYMLFAGYDRPQSEEQVRETTWKEVIHKARVKVRRVPLDVVIETARGAGGQPPKVLSSPDTAQDEESAAQMRGEARADEFAYQIVMIEDFDDDRVHEFEGDQAQPEPFDDVARAGIREIIPIHEVSKIFYADTSKVLNISSDTDTHAPVLLLKRDVNAIPPRRMLERELHDEQHEEETVNSIARNAQPPDVKRERDVNKGIDKQKDPWQLPPSLDREWIAFEVYTETSPSETESEAEEQSGLATEGGTNLEDSMTSLSLEGESDLSPQFHLPTTQLTTLQAPPWVNAIRTSLSLLELLLRLTSLQQFQQQSHLSINDELLNFFLEESSTTGAGGDEAHRQAVRAEARRRVGWDPYDESPVKRRGEDYLQYPVAAATGAGDDDDDDGQIPRPQVGARVNSPGLGLVQDARSPWTPSSAAGGPLMSSSVRASAQAHQLTRRTKSSTTNTNNRPGDPSSSPHLQSPSVAWSSSPSPLAPRPRALPEDTRGTDRRTLAVGGGGVVVGATPPPRKLYPRRQAVVPVSPGPAGAAPLRSSKEKNRSSRLSTGGAAPEEDRGKGGNLPDEGIGTSPGFLSSSITAGASERENDSGFYVK